MPPSAEADVALFHEPPEDELEPPQAASATPAPIAQSASSGRRRRIDEPALLVGDASIQTPWWIAPGVATHGTRPGVMEETISGMCPWRVVPFRRAI
jgi:hypothetical protein